MSAPTCGLDVHKSWTDVTVRRNEDGEIVASRRRLPNATISRFLAEHPGISKVAMEASTSMVPLYRELKEEGQNVVVSHPKKTRLIAESVIKTDRVDSEALSELARINALPLAYMPPPEISELREKVRRRAFLVRMRAKLKTKIRMHLLQEGVKEPEEQGLFTKKGVEWLHSINSGAAESYLAVISSLSKQIGSCRGTSRRSPPRTRMSSC
jgi:transposase